MSEKIITELVLEGEKEAIASIQRVGNAADATFADLKNVQLDFDFIEPKKGLKLLTDAGQRFARQPRLKPCGCDPITIRSGSIATRSPAGAGHVHPRSMRELELTPKVMAPGTASSMESARPD